MEKSKTLTILMAEDNEDHAELMSEALYEFNSENKVQHVLNGEAALAYLRNDEPYEDKQANPDPDIIFLDLRMPRLGGLETLIEIKKDERFQEIPIMMISTSDTEREIAECYRRGASGYVTKPLRFEELAKKIKELNYYWVMTAELPNG